MTNNKLKGLECYLSGPMEYAPDGGVKWRNEITEFLNEMGVIVLDPTKRIHPSGMNEFELQKAYKDFEASGQIDECEALARDIRRFDLRLVDKCDFMIVLIDQSIPMCGTWDELFKADQQYKPVLVVWVNRPGDSISLWMRGTIPNKNIFLNFKDLRAYLEGLDQDIFKMDKRWKNISGVRQ